jgi:hypothetical protein
MPPREKAPPRAVDPVDAVADPQLAGRNHPEFDPRTGRRWEAPIIEDGALPADPPKPVKDTGRRLLGDK